MPQMAWGAHLLQPLQALKMWVDGCRLAARIVHLGQLVQVALVVVLAGLAFAPAVLRVGVLLVVLVTSQVSQDSAYPRLV